MKDWKVPVYKDLNSRFKYYTNPCHIWLNIYTKVEPESHRQKVTTNIFGQNSNFIEQKDTF